MTKKDHITTNSIIDRLNNFKIAQVIELKNLILYFCSFENVKSTTVLRYYKSSEKNNIFLRLKCNT